MKNKIILNRIKFIIIILLPALFYLSVFFLVRFNTHDFCIWKIIFKHECWGCGMTRAFYALFHWQFMQAYNLNPRVYIVAPIFTYLWLKLLRKNFHLFK